MSDSDKRWRSESKPQRDCEAGAGRRADARTHHVNRKTHANAEEETTKNHHDICETTIEAVACHHTRASASPPRRVRPRRGKVERRKKGGGRMARARVRQEDANEDRATTGTNQTNRNTHTQRGEKTHQPAQTWMAATPLLLGTRSPVLQRRDCRASGEPCVRAENKVVSCAIPFSVADRRNSRVQTPTTSPL